MLKIGQLAPDFTAASTKGDISLSSYRGKWVVMFFYPLDFTPVWSTEIPELNRSLSEFERLNSVVLGANTDSVPTHEAWAKSIGGIDFPLLSDYDKKLSEKYGVLTEAAGGISLRGVFIIDPQGVLQYLSVNNLDVGRNVKEILRLLAACQMGGACPVNWEEGQETL